jgi:hypothetical protein
MKRNGSLRFLKKNSFQKSRGSKEEEALHFWITQFMEAAEHSILSFIHAPERPTQLRIRVESSSEIYSDEKLMVPICRFPGQNAWHRRVSHLKRPGVEHKSKS